MYLSRESKGISAPSGQLCSHDSVSRLASRSIYNSLPFFIALTLDPGNFEVTNSNQIVTLQLTFRTTFRRSIAHVQSAGKHEKSRLNGAGMLEAGIFSMNF